MTSHVYVKKTDGIVIGHWSFVIGHPVPGCAGETPLARRSLTKPAVEPCAWRVPDAVREKTFA